MDDLLALAFVGGGAALLGSIGGHLLADYRHRKTMAQRDERIAHLSERLARALNAERDAKQDAETLRSEQGVWAKRLLAMRDQLEARR